MNSDYLLGLLLIVSYCGWFFYLNTGYSKLWQRVIFIPSCLVLSFVSGAFFFFLNQALLSSINLKTAVWTPSGEGSSLNTGFLIFWGCVIFAVLTTWFLDKCLWNPTVKVEQ